MTRQERPDSSFHNLLPSVVAILITRFMFGLRRLGSATSTTIQAFSHTQEPIWRIPAARLDAIEMAPIGEVDASSH